MASKTSKRGSIGGMKPEEIKAQLDSLLKMGSDNAAPALNAFASFQERRAARLSKAAKRLEKDLGKDHPDIQMIKDAAAAATARKVVLSKRATRISRIPRIKDHEWMVYGRVLDANGDPLKNQTVRLFDKDRKYDDLLGETTTDEFGDFHIVYHERDFLEHGEALPELYLMVSDAKGNVLHSSKDDLRFDAGRVEYFEVRLGKSPKKTKRK